MTQIKICGLTCREDALLVNEFKTDYAGFVLYYPKSRRNITEEQALNIKGFLDRRIKTVAVTVNPSQEQLKRIGDMGFAYVQIHGIVPEQVVEKSPLPVFRAINVRGENRTVLSPMRQGRTVAYVFDGQQPGGGLTFDWNALDGFDRENRLLILAGGLHAQNVREAICLVKPDIVDVSTGVEKDSGGKDRDKLAAFVRAVRNEA